MVTRKLKIANVAHIMFLLDSTDLHHSLELLELGLYLLWIDMGVPQGCASRHAHPCLLMAKMEGRVRLDISQALASSLW